MSAKIIQVIVTDDRIGLGKEGDPVRRAFEMYTLDGEKIISIDPFGGKEDEKFYPRVIYFMENISKLL